MRKALQPAPPETLDLSLVAELNLTGLGSPRPVIDTSVLFRKCDSGDRLRAWSTDPGFEASLRRELPKTASIQAKHCVVPERFEQSHVPAGTPAWCVDIVLD